MDRAYLEIIYLCGMVFQVILHVYYFQFYKTDKQKNYFSKRERLFLLLILIGFLFLPLIYIFSTWFSYLDYNLPKWLGFFSTALYCFGVWLFFRSYADLGAIWSPGIEISEGHRLITSGSFEWVRHPMYAAYAVIAIAQAFMIQNWIVGPAFLLLALPFYHYRIDREERQLILYFGNEYRSYRNKTNALFPRTEQISTLPIPTWIRPRLNQIKKINLKFKKQNSNTEEKSVFDMRTGETHLSED